ncbi:MAG: type II toxin-antitoxin system RelE/ParE family toxin [Alphaproteobacteria bacterium]
MILHSIVKKSQATPDKDLKLARRRMKEVQS